MMINSTSNPVVESGLALTGSKAMTTNPDGNTGINQRTSQAPADATRSTTVSTMANQLSEASLRAQGPRCTPDQSGAGVGAIETQSMSSKPILYCKQIETRHRSS